MAYAWRGEKHGVTACKQSYNKAKGMCMACVLCCVHDGERKHSTHQKVGIHGMCMWWHSICVKQSIYHSKGMYYCAKQVFRHGIKQIKHASKHGIRQATKQGNRHKASKMQNPSKWESQNESQSLESPMESTLSLWPSPPRRWIDRHRAKRERVTDNGEEKQR